MIWLIVVPLFTKRKMGLKTTIYLPTNRPVKYEQITHRSQPNVDAGFAKPAHDPAKQVRPSHKLV